MVCKASMPNCGRGGIVIRTGFIFLQTIDLQSHMPKCMVRLNIFPSMCLVTA